MSGFHDRLQAARIGAGYRTPELMAAALGLAASTVRRWENGTEPSISSLEEFCRFTKTSSDWLLGLSNRKGLR